MFVISVTINLKAQKYGGLSFQPIGRVRGMAINGVELPLMSVEMTTSKPKAAVKESAIQ
jgi:hypothetical protein